MNHGFLKTGGRRAAALALCCLFAPGCASLFNQPSNVEATRADVETLRRDQTELLALVRELKARLEAQAGTVSQLRADNNIALRQLEEKIDILSARLEEQGSRPGSSSRSSPPPMGGESGSGPVTVTSPNAGGNAEAAFDAANRDFLKGSYELAVAGFQDYLRQAPQSPRADDAQFMIGESYYSQEDNDRAIQEYLKVRDVYSGGDQVAKATLKIGYAFLRKGDEATARRYFETVIREFPGSEEALLAQDKIKSLR